MKIRTDVLAALDGAVFNGNAMKLADQLERNLYQDVARIIEAAGGKWNRKARAHIFQGDARDRIEPVLLTGEVTNSKQDFGQFYTPMSLAVKIVDLLIARPGMRMLEPSAGRGALAAEALLRGALVDCVEIDARNVDMLCSVGYAGVVRGDFLQQEPQPVYDVVGMNPPFARQADIHHVLHAAKFLRPSGRLSAIMSAGVAFRQNKLTADFRAFVAGRDGTIEPLPDNSFRASGTNVNTVLVSF